MKTILCAAMPAKSKKKAAAKSAAPEKPVALKIQLTPLEREVLQDWAARERMPLATIARRVLLREAKGVDAPQTQKKPATEAADLLQTVVNELRRQSSSE